MKWSLTLLIFVLLCVHLCTAQQDSGSSLSTGDAASIHQIEALVASYAKSVGNLNENLARKVWSARDQVTFIHPRGTERGLEAILRNFYQSTMGLFSER